MQLAKITIAAHHLEPMVDFYNNVFHANLRPLQGFDTLIYEGRLAGIRLILCPREAFGPMPEASPQQFKFMTPTLNNLAERVVAAGGCIERTHADPFDGSQRLWVRDPDGNIIEFEQPCPAKIG
ncbi:MAG: hypothetical protein CUN55_02385 [Phototrophicales bacterium]|nr:MAG: hypothetical protein CUN55_02385 [Phototrophicales bacterium]